MTTGTSMVRAALGAAAFALGLAGSWSGGQAPGGADAPRAASFGIATAEARPAARAAMRVDQRTTRRADAESTAYYDTLPEGCVARGRYWYCGGAYYQEVNHDGRNVYMVVTP